MSAYKITVIYYTSNKEDPGFEGRIQENLLKVRGGLPIISVSQKPIDLGKNICVGDVGHTYFNEYRQILIGAKAAKTLYVIFAESDFLYPQCYFSFEPKGANIYRYRNIWIVHKDPKIYAYRRKIHSIGAQICKREYLIKILEKNLEGKPEWSDKEVVIRDRKGFDLFNVPFEFFGDDIACISFKTGDGMRRQTNIMPGRENIKLRLPYWGHVSNLRKEYL